MLHASTQVPDDNLWCRRGNGYEADPPFFRQFRVGLATQHGWYTWWGAVTLFRHSTNFVGRLCFGGDTLSILRRGSPVMEAVC